MPWMLRGAATLAVSAILVGISPRSLAFQEGLDSPRVSISPRARPAPAPDPTDTPTPNLRVDSPLVLIPARVTTFEGTPITTLGKENFRVFEEGVEEPITYFAKDDGPVSVGLVFDTSGSMGDKRQKATEAAASFFRTATSQDEFFLVQFDDRPRLAVPFTPHPDDVYERIRRTRPFGRTSLLDAIHLALTQMKAAVNPRKAIVILSDGGDNRSRHTFTQIKNELLESDVQLYAMGIFDTSEDHKLAPEEANGPQLLDDLAGKSGGTHFRVENVRDLPEISERLGQELRSEYLIGYSPSNRKRDGKYRRVKVELVNPGEGSDLRLYYRTGYYAPAE